ncbi:hypothetical protein N9L68_07520, partial [bacterium]|nr:hypothetical protein [bacterium]
VRKTLPHDPRAVKAELMEGVHSSSLRGGPRRQGGVGQRLPLDDGHAAPRSGGAAPRRRGLQGHRLGRGAPRLREDLGRRGGSDDRAGHHPVPRL